MLGPDDGSRHRVRGESPGRSDPRGHVPVPGGRRGQAGGRAGGARRRLRADGQQSPGPADRRSHSPCRAAGTLALLPAGRRRGGPRRRGPGRRGATACATRSRATRWTATGAASASARTCYSHLAGRLGVALADALIAERWLEEDGRSYRLTPAGTGVAARARDRRARSRGAARGAAVPGLDGAPAARRRPRGHGPGGPRPRARLGATRAGHASGRRHAGGARAAQEGLQPAMGGRRS